MNSIEQFQFKEPYDRHFTIFYLNDTDDEAIHWHKHYELIYVLEGQVQVIFEQQSLSLSQQDILFVAAYENHSIIQAKGAKLMMIQFLPDLVDPSFRQFFEIKYLIPMMNPDKMVKLSSKDREFLKWMFDDILFNYDHTSIASTMAIRGSIIRLIAFLINDRHLNMPKFANDKQQQVSKILSVLEFLQHHFPEELNEKKAAEIAGYNYSYFSDLFKKVIGQTFTEYTNYLRLSEAKNQLISSKQSITVISENVGYRNLSYFNRMFKKYTSMTPRQYRQANT